MMSLLRQLFSVTRKPVQAISVKSEIKAGRRGRRGGRRRGGADDGPNHT